MNKIITVGNWIFEEKQKNKQFFARKTKEFGKKFEASAVITVINNLPEIELFINKHHDKFTRQDYRDFVKFIKSIGFKEARYERFQNGTKKEVNKTR